MKRISATMNNWKHILNTFRRSGSHWPLWAIQLHGTHFCYLQTHCNSEASGDSLCPLASSHICGITASLTMLSNVGVCRLVTGDIPSGLFHRKLVIYSPACNNAISHQLKGISFVVGRMKHTDAGLFCYSGQLMEFPLISLIQWELKSSSVC